MSDDNSPVVEEQKKKRGRQPKADKGAAVKEAKKRGRSATEKTANNKPKSDTEDGDTGSAPAKRGRGRPKKKVYWT